MGYHSPFSTPDNTPLAPELVEASTPWSDVLLEDLRTTVQFNPPARLVHRLGIAPHGPSRKRLRGRIKAFWSSCLLLVGFLWISKRSHSLKPQHEKNGLERPKLDGLRFMNANHPHIRVDDSHSFQPCSANKTQYVGRWLATADETHKDGSFPGSLS